MANNQLSDEELQTLIIELQQTAYRLNGTNSAYLMSDAIKPLRELQECRKAAMDSEPVFFIEVEGDDWINAGRIEGKKRPDLGLLPDGINYLYAAPQPAPDREHVRREHAEWSQATFGNVGPVGPLKHLSKEALEAAAEPGDLSEWADMQFLMWDAQRRAGITDEQITQAMIEKLAVNKQREWPEPKEGEPRLHIKEQPAPVVTFYRDGIEAAAKWIDQQREAYDSEHGWSDPDTGAFEFSNDAQRGYSSTLEELAEGIRALHPNAGNSPVHGESRCGNSPVIPDGYVMVPAKLTAENGAKSALLGEFNLEYTLTCHECFGEGCEDCNDEGRWINSIPVDWTTIKAIWAKAVEHFVATQQEEKSE